MAEARGWARDADPTYAEVLARAEYEPRRSCLAQGLDARVVRWGRDA